MPVKVVKGFTLVELLVVVAIIVAADTPQAHALTRRETHADESTRTGQIALHVQSISK